MHIKSAINKPYLLIAILLFIIEVLIAIYVHDTIVRPYIGDFLVVILIYCFVKSFVKLPVFATSISVLIFAYLVEISQYFHLVKLLGLQHISIARIIMGTSFEWMDMIVYTVGILVVLFIEKYGCTTQKLSFSKLFHYI